MVTILILIFIHVGKNSKAREVMRAIEGSSKWERIRDQIFQERSRRVPQVSIYSYSREQKVVKSDWQEK